jgi:hypothetical protein
MNKYPKDLGNNRWVIEVKGDKNSDELYLELPPNVLNQMGWDPGDIIVWTEQDNGSFLLTKKASNEQD